MAYIGQVVSEANYRPGVLSFRRETPVEVLVQNIGPRGFRIVADVDLIEDELVSIQIDENPPRFARVTMARYPRFRFEF